MHHTHRYLTKCSIYDYGKTNGNEQHIEWIKCQLGQSCLAANNVWFAAEMEETFRQISNGEKNAMQTFLERLNVRLNDFVAKGMEKLINYLK